MKLLLFTYIALLTNSAFSSCNPEGNMLEIIQCQVEIFNKADHKLNTTYQALIKKRQEDKTFVADLRRAQRAWIKFRDAELELMYSCSEANKQFCWGSIYRLDYLNDKEEFTKERTQFLKNYLGEEGKDDSKAASNELDKSTSNITDAWLVNGKVVDTDEFFSAIMDLWGDPRVICFKHDVSFAIVSARKILKDKALFISANKNKEKVIIKTQSPLGDGETYSSSFASCDSGIMKTN